MGGAVGDASEEERKPEGAKAEGEGTLSGMPEPYAALLVGLDAAIRDGAEDRVTDTVARVIGRPPRRFEDFARAHAHVFQGA